jgi:hypothetical protein
MREPSGRNATVSGAAALDIDLAGVEREAGRFIAADDVVAASRMMTRSDSDHGAVAFLHLLALSAQLLECWGMVFGSTGR